MEKRKGNGWKDLIIIGSFFIAFLGLIVNNYKSMQRSNFAETQAVIKANKERLSDSQSLNIKIALIENEQIDARISILKTDNEILNLNKRVSYIEGSLNFDNYQLNNLTHIHEDIK